MDARQYEHMLFWFWTERVYPVVFAVFGVCIVTDRVS